MSKNRIMVNKEQLFGLLDFSVTNGTAHHGIDLAKDVIEKLYNLITETREELRVFERAQGEIIPGLNNEFFEARWVRETVQKAFDDAIMNIDDRELKL